VYSVQKTSKQHAFVHAVLSFVINYTTGSNH